MLQYRLDKDDALVQISAAVVGAGRTVLTVERIQKITPSEKESLTKSLAVEWTTALQGAGAETVPTGTSPASSKYWEEPARKARRILSEPVTPSR